MFSLHLAQHHWLYLGMGVGLEAWPEQKGLYAHLRTSCDPACAGMHLRWCFANTPPTGLLPESCLDKQVQVWHLGTGLGPWSVVFTPWLCRWVVEAPALGEVLQGALRSGYH